MARLLAPLFALLFVLIQGGCAPEPETRLVADPGTIRFDPHHTRAKVAIRNVGRGARPIRDVRLGGDDWDALRFVDESLPRSASDRGLVEIELELAPNTFRLAEGGYRRGRALLEFESEGERHAIPIEFAPEPARSGSPLFALLVSIVLVAGAILLARSRKARGSARDSTSWRGWLREPILLGSLLGLLASCALLSLLPLTSTLCLERLGAALGPLEVDQCRAGLGGFGGRGFGPTPIWPWLLGCASASAIAFAMLGATGRAAQMAQRLLGLALLAPALAIAAGDDPFAPGRLELAGVVMPALGILVQPFAFVILLGLVGRVDAEHPDSCVRWLARIDDLAWAVLLVVLFFGAGSIPGIHGRDMPIFVHGFEVGAMLVAFSLEVAAVVWLVGRLRAGRQGQRVGRRTLLLLAAVDSGVALGWVLATNS